MQAAWTSVGVRIDMLESAACKGGETPSAANAMVARKKVIVYLMQNLLCGLCCDTSCAPVFLNQEQCLPFPAYPFLRIQIPPHAFSIRSGSPSQKSYQRLCLHSLLNRLTMGSITERRASTLLLLCQGTDSPVRWTSLLVKSPTA